ncbi:unnamed protein product [Polarella glacialis]|uniref:Uncharacterized protein n=1 Tax=Polarella glacialis TaxID=89957 RepID=A0A813G518_POLGL|nr:unnamed protein product [Polarella glacialis]
MLALTSTVHGILPPFGSMDRHETADVLSFFAALSGATLVKWARRSHLAESQRGAMVCASSIAGTHPSDADQKLAVGPGCPSQDAHPRMPIPGCHRQDALARMPSPGCPRQDALARMPSPGCPRQDARARMPMQDAQPAQNESDASRG